MLDEKCTMTRNKSACSRIQDFCSFGKESPNYLDHVSEQVDKYRGQTVPLEKPAGYPMRIGGLDDTIYAEMEDELEAWEDFYLPERVEMRVIGAIDMFPSLAVGLQLIILAGKDGNIYAYENEVLHQVADSLQDLFQKGIEFPGTKVYNYGECFAPMTEEEYDELMQDEEVKKMKEETRKSIKSNEAEFLSILARIEEKENAEKVASNKIVPSDHHRPKNVVVQLWMHADESFIFHLSDDYYEMWCKIFPLLRPTCEELESNGTCRKLRCRFRALPCDSCDSPLEYILIFDVYVFGPEKGIVPQLQWHPNSCMLTANADIFEACSINYQRVC